MRFLLDQDQQVAINAAMPCGVTLPAHGELHALGHARRDVDRDDIVVANNALAITSRALLYDNLALATTSRTGRLRLHLAQDGIGDTGNDTRTLTGVAGLHAIGALGARPVTFRAGHIFLDLDLLLDTGRDFLQVQLYLHTQVRPAVNPTAATRTAAKPAETSEATKVTTEDITELREDIIHGETTRALRSAPDTRMTELVVTLTFLRVAQHVIGLCRLLEFLLGILITRILIRMVLNRLLTVRFLYLLIRGVLLNAKHLIIIPFRHLLKIITIT